MKISRKELRMVVNFLRDPKVELSRTLLAKIELRIGLVAPVIVSPGLEFLQETAGPLFIEVPPEPGIAYGALQAFRENVFSYLLVRIDESWQCIMRCNGEILEQTCEEEKRATVACCFALRERCGAY